VPGEAKAEVRGQTCWHLQRVAKVVPRGGPKVVGLSRCHRQDADNATNPQCDEVNDAHRQATAARVNGWPMGRLVLPHLQAETNDQRRGGER